DLNLKRRLTAKELAGKITDAERTQLAEIESRIGDIDFTRLVRDPLYHQFVQAMSAVEAQSSETSEPSPIELSEEEKKRRAQLAEDIVRDLITHRDARSGEAR